MVVVAVMYTDPVSVIAYCISCNVWGHLLVNIYPLRKSRNTVVCKCRGENAIRLVHISRNASTATTILNCTSSNYGRTVPYLNRP